MARLGPAMKLHFSIAAAEELRDRRGGARGVELAAGWFGPGAVCLQVYSVCLQGFLLGKARYSQLRRWDARDTFKIQTKRAFLDVYLADGSNNRLEIQTLDTAERILEVTLFEMGLSRELMKYFSLFFFQDHDNGVLSVMKKVAEFELPYVSLQSMKELYCKLGIRKWYMDSSLDTLLMDCTASLNLLYMQAIQEVERNWVKPTEEQMQELGFLQKKKANKVKSATKDGEEDTLEVRFEYNDSGTWQWIILYTKQAFLLSSCLKKMVSEQMIKAAKESQETAAKEAKLELMEKEEGKKHA